MSVEVDLLFACARTHIDPERAEQISVLLRQNIDWEHLTKLALVHRVLPLLYQSLSAACPHDVPEAILDQLKNHFDANAKRNLFLADELLKVLNLLKAHHIPAIPFKGPVLAVFAYGDLSTRHAGDLDILVNVEDAINAKDILISLGCERAYDVSDDEQFRTMNHFTVVQNPGRIVVEIHWELMPGGYHYRVDLDDLWARAQPLSLAGETVLTIPTQDLMLFLCAHGAKHSWMRLSWICDLAELIRARRDLDLEMTLRRARKIGSERVFLLGLLLANRFLGVTLPEGVRRKIQRDRIAQSLASEVYAQRLAQIQDSPSIEENLCYYLKAKERSIDKIRCLRYYGQIPSDASREALPLRVRFSLAFLSAVQPNKNDTDVIILPRSLYFLYYFVRPFRLIAKYARSPSKVYRKTLEDS
jgi:hypothetical protein